MPAIPRPFIAAGVAVVGTSAIAMSPVVVPLPSLRVEAAIQLTATTNWADVFSHAGANAQALFDAWREAPAPILQQIVANLGTYVTELPDLPRIVAQILANLQAAQAAPLAPDTSTLDSTHRTFYELLPAIVQLPGVPDLLQLSISPTGQQVLALSTTALSGIVLGLAGPLLGPLVALAASVESIRADLSAATPDVAGALSTLASVPAAMADAFLNGGEHVDITALAKTFGPAIGVSFPDGVQVGIVVGGLLSPGGSIFNALDFAYDNDLLGVLHIHVPLATGNAVGPIGAMMEFARVIAKAIRVDGAGGAAATQRPAAQSLAAANELPRSVVDSTTPTVSVPIAAKASSSRVAKADKGARFPRDSKAGNATIKRPSAAAGSGKASSARTNPPKAAAAG